MKRARRSLVGGATFVGGVTFLASLLTGCQSAPRFPYRGTAASSPCLVFAPQDAPRAPFRITRSPWPAWIEPAHVGDYAEYEVRFDDVSGLIRDHDYGNMANTTVRSTHEIRTGYGRTPR